MTPLGKPVPIPLGERLRRRIHVEGPITFAEFMDAALYDPTEGYYSRSPVGEQGDFLTSPHVSEAFAALLAVQVCEFWDLLDRPDPFSIVEVGAGDGTLARQLLSSLPSSLRRAARYTAVETGAASRSALASLGVSVAESLDEVPTRIRGCVLANELLDNLPFHRMRHTARGLVELFVDVEGEGFRLVEGMPSSSELNSLAPRLTQGGEAVVSTAALRFIERCARLLERGYVWIADYAASSEVSSASVHGYRAHRLEEDVLSGPGTRDITSGVDFNTLVRHARSLGLSVWGPVSQRQALLSLGFRAWDARTRDAQVDALSRRDGAAAARAYSERNKAALLIDPDRLGGFSVVCLGIDTPLRPPLCMRGG